MNDEYLSVIYASLLHDIGKFAQRSVDTKTQHSSFSEDFIEENRACFENPDLVKTLVGHHHEASYVPESCRPSAISDARTRALALLISRADSLASSERSQERSNQDYQTRSPMDCVFNHVNIGKNYSIGNLKYPLGRLFEGSIFPEEMNSPQIPMEKFEQFLNSFKLEFAQIFKKSYLGMEDTLLALIQKYLWCIPSDTTKVDKDISLADHLKITCAIAACMYQYHEENGWDESLIRDETKEKLCLACGDVSGIQSYIYQIVDGSQTGGVSKRLRARSYRIALLTEAAAIRILKKLNLPMACKIMAGGGQFSILIPNTETAISLLNNEVQSISDWMLKEYTGELSICMGRTELKKDELEQGQFDKVLKRARSDVSRNKKRKFEHTLQAGPQVFENHYEGLGACPICDRLPANPPDSEGRPQPCNMCKLDEEIGRQLTKESNLWLVISEKKAEHPIHLFDDWYGNLASSNRVTSLNPQIALNLRGNELLPGIPCGFSPHAGYVPRWSGVEKYEDCKKKYPSLQDEFDAPTLRSGEAVKSFSALALESEGDPLLGILRADVDNLGLVFTLGTKGTASLSRMATMSTFLNLFFSWDLPKLIREKYPNVYVAYTGGDDLMLAGPWDRMVPLAREVQTRLAKFTGNNPNITISAGIGTFKSKAPIALSSDIAGEILERAKSAGRDRLSLFETTLEWKHYDELIKQYESLTEGLSDPDAPGASKALLYRLLEYQKQALDYYEKNNAQAALYRSHLAYEIGRNFAVTDKSSATAKNLHDFLVSLLSAKQDEWRLLSASITACSYRLRKGN